MTSAYTPSPVCSSTVTPPSEPTSFTVLASSSAIASSPLDTLATDNRSFSDSSSRIESIYLIASVAVSSIILATSIWLCPEATSLRPAMYKW